MGEIGKKFSPNSIDLIFTDPPYTEGSLSVYGDLAKLAQMVLNPGGSMVTVAGHYALFKINDLIRSNSDLVYHWQIVIRHSGSKKRLHGYRVWAYYKPLLWYYKPVDGNGHGPTMYQDVADLIESKTPIKDDHKWEHSTIEAAHMIKPLTVKNNIILDPFMGPGTTGVAALELGRKFIGIDNDKIAFQTATRRLNQFNAQTPKITLPMN